MIEGEQVSTTERCVAFIPIGIASHTLGGDPTETLLPNDL